ncbi:MAG: hypothetical protein HOI61_03990 [Gammaproteobacteria bacterium]|jgi:hypothetical protein|nr:hypothetical protein [Gammaproteobacteria bacterium]MBT3846184.1 hypothetical protein [Gammaproteobacteria bacterium]MBT3894109.1 hypothetical protein [Gammaproteobacteria bacterium]MBT4300447.1 hypothetical protein [Gammaproteobacteria bacterium]MBT5687657.1 hypothetical protein [Gammaproteobacteria bacterium]
MSRGQTKAIELSESASVIFLQLGSLFKAIADASDKHSHVRKLAEVGQYQSEDFGNLYDCEREELVNTLKGARS